MAWSAYGSIRGSGYKIAGWEKRGQGVWRRDELGLLTDQCQGQGAGSS